MTQPTTPEICRIRLILDVSCALNGETPANMVARLQSKFQRAIDEGMLTEGATAEVDEYSMEALIQPDPLTEEELADFMRKRIEDGDLAIDDCPVRMARFGLMEPGDFVSEMRERMELAKSEASPWEVALTMENGTKFEWTGDADDQGHAEGQAIAEAVAQTGEQVQEVLSVNKR